MFISLHMFHSQLWYILFTFVLFLCVNFLGINLNSILTALVFNFVTRSSSICVLFVFRDEPYHGTGDYSVPYGGVPAHHSAWPHPDVQQLQAPQQDTRPQRYEMAV